MIVCAVLIAVLVALAGYLRHRMITDAVYYDVQMDAMRAVVAERRELDERAAIAGAVLSALGDAPYSIVGAALASALRQARAADAVFLLLDGGAIRPLGLVPGELEGERMGAYATPEFADAWARAIRDGSTDYETTFADADGVKRHYLGVVIRVGEIEARALAGQSSAEVTMPQHAPPVACLWIAIDATRLVSEMERLRERADETAAQHSRRIRREALALPDGRGDG